MVDTPVEGVTNAEASAGAEGTTTTPEPLTAEKLEQTLNSFLERAERTIQSAKDKAVGEVRRQAPQTSGVGGLTPAQLRQQLEDIDPEVAEKIENRLLKAEAQARALRDADSQRVADEQGFAAQFTSKLTDLCTEAGIDPKDTNLDWAEDAGSDYLVRMGRFQASVVKAIRAKGQAAANETAEQKKAREIEERKNAGLESHVTGDVAGDTTVITDKDFLQKFADGDVAMTKVNIARAEKLMQVDGDKPLA